MKLIKKDISKLLRFVFPVILFIAGINYFVDPGNIFKTNSNEKQIFKALSSGYNAAFTVTMSQVDEVRLLKYSVEAMHEAPDFLVIGSSRAFTVNKKLFDPYRFYNASISACSMGDLLAVFDLFEEKKLTPKILVISLDPDFFVLSPQPRLDLLNNFFNMLNEIKVQLSFNEKYDLVKYYMVEKIKISLELFSPAYFQDSLKVLAYKNFGLDTKLNSKNSQNSFKMPYYATVETYAPGGVIFPDGSRQFSNTQRLMEGQKKIDHIAQQVEGMQRIKDRSFLIRNDSCKIFEAFVHYLQSKNIRVLFLLVPHHSLLINYERAINSNKSISLIVEEYILNFARANKIVTIGSFEASKAKFTDDDMIDQHHPHRTSISKLFSKETLRY